MPNPYLTEVLAGRWSPRDYAERPIEPEKLYSLFEAARWASSCFNEQPWRFVTATKDDQAGFAKILGLMVEKNQEWAKKAWLIGFTAAKKTFSHNGAPNRFPLHDVGAASASLAVEASALGLQSHFLGGFDAARARSEFGVPDDFEIGAGFGVGYPGENAHPGERKRKALDEIVFGPAWGETANLTAVGRGSPTDCREWEYGLNQIILTRDFDAAFVKYYAEDVVMQDNMDEPRVGLAVNREREKQFLAMLAEVHPIRLLSSGVDGMRSYSEWAYDFTFKDGKRVQIEEAAARQWKDGKVVRERFYLNRQS